MSRLVRDITTDAVPLADPAAAAWAREHLAAGGWAAVFAPAEPGQPARLGRLVLYRPSAAARPVPASTAVPQAVERVRLELVLPHGGGVRTRTVEGWALDPGGALALLLDPSEAAVHPSLAAWAAVARRALELLGEGRLYPALTSDTYPTWRFGPPGARGRRDLDALAAALPPHAHNLPAPQTDRTVPQIAEPATLVREFCDALADALPRTPAARWAAPGNPYADRATALHPGLAEWAAEAASERAAQVGVELRVEPPAGRRRAFQAVLQLRTAADPSLVLDAAELWADPVRTQRLLGPHAEAEALLALRRAARAWQPLTRLLAEAAPSALGLDDEEAMELLGDAANALRTAGVCVHWPRELVKALEMRAEIGAATAPGATVDTLLGRDALLDFSWHVALGGEQLTEGELDLLAEARRPLVRLRDQWVVADPRLVARLKRQRTRGLAPLDALQAVLTGEVEWDGERVAVEAAGAFGELVARLRDPDARAPIRVPEGLTATLRDYQKRGLAWLADMTRLTLGGILADDMGLGKTVTLLALHLHRQEQPDTAGPALVVCPASLLGNWQREAAHFASAVPVRRYHGGERTLDHLAGDELVLVTYGVLRKDRERLAAVKWSLVAADEAQHVKNPYATTARELRALPARARVALTGTPVENNLSELWALLDWTTPGLLGPLSAFRDRFAKAIERGALGADGDEETAEQARQAAGQLARLTRPFLLRRRKSDPGIAPELPAKTETDHPITLTREQAALYEAQVRETMALIEKADGIARRGLVLKLLTALKQICNHPAHYLRETGPLPGRSGKLELLDELLDTVVAEDHSALVFTQYTQMGRLLERHFADRGIRARYLHGATPVPRREDMVAAFQQGEFPVFLLSLKAAGTGLNLTRATHVVHYDRWWNPAVEDQATDRAYRIGQDRPVQVHRLTTQGTVEDKVARLLGAKRALADQIVTSGEAALTELSDADLAELVALSHGADA
ncbi:DEAD/DEAH box helicase [Streptomyces himalayensis]|uniref:DEAD/DEAH box helicase n=1 Tax=Streptomyces himalayensis subsp. himalayensis TaxID=2756131 RepID=A0A7W0DIC8_9ACTN|nr:DEAD/DEAH box helicase [Streptomyces himalayensis]MBA2945659.1 DEAD/DEAH box helicase [Streptomyces himalayensis subsp. himalayensis]